MRAILILNLPTYLFLSLIIATYLLAGCAPSEPDALANATLPPLRSEPTDSDLDQLDQDIQPSSDPTLAPVETCTDSGCSNSIRINLNGPSLSEFIVEMTDEAQNKTILHCLPPMEPRAVAAQPYQLNTPEMSEVIDISPAPQMCGDNQAGYASIWPPYEGFQLEKVVVQCAQSDLVAFQTVVDSMLCFNSDSQRGFGLRYGENRPDVLPLTIYWDVYSTTVQLQPDYANNSISWSPNGPACESTCASTIVTIDLP